jgi:cytochrome c biogenesis protein CcmG/thiol:disulfide interchange protein DsbE
LKASITETVTLALLFLVLSSGVFAQAPAKAPPLVLTDLKGNRFRLEDYKGKVTLVNFWATWCPPCRTEIPELVRWQREYRTQGLQVIGITYPPQRLSEVRRFTRKTRVNYPVAIGSKATKMFFTSSDTLPMTVVIDSEGTVRDVIEGVVFPEEFDQKVKPLLTGEISGPVFKTSPSKRNPTNVQEATILVNAEGYQPTNTRLRRGVRTRLTFIRNVAETCGTEIVIPAYGINRPLPLNVPVVISFTPARSGRIKLTCGMNMFRGSLIVR